MDPDFSIGAASVDRPPALPSKELSRILADWTSGARNRLYRVADLRRRRSVLELGAGWGFVSEELLERTSATITALDMHREPLENLAARTRGRITIRQGDAHDLPFRHRQFDLVVCQFAFLWFAQTDRVVQEISRVLAPGGAVLCIEPDYGGLMEDPESGLRETWLDLLTAAGAKPCIGRALPRVFRSHGLHAKIYFCDRYVAADPVANLFLSELAEVPGEVRDPSAAGPAMNPADPKPAAEQILFLPLWMMHASPKDAVT
jgi:SAM-dependent methyltransferase